MRACGKLVVVDGVFSMEGDVAPLPQIVELAAKHGARLMVDEAHGAGVLGARGAGACELLGVEDRVDLRMGTFSKSLASCGGLIAGSAEVIDYLRISSRAFLFSASAVPAAVAAALDMSYRNLPATRRRFFRRLGLHAGPDLDAYAGAALDDVVQSLPYCRPGSNHLEGTNEPRFLPRLELCDIVSGVRH